MSVIDEIKDRLDIVDVVSSYVQLKKAGRTFKGLCPFHSEKTPSFVVFPDSQNWHCFGACGTGGDIFSFVMRRENLDFGDALRCWRAKAGVELSRRANPAQPKMGESSACGPSSRMRPSISTTSLSGRPRPPSRGLPGEPGLARETWETWQLGYSLDSWDALKIRLQGKGYQPEEVEEAGLTIRKEETGSYFDRFRGRLMIPIRDGQGRTIAFGARICATIRPIPVPST